MQEGGVSRIGIGGVALRITLEICTRGCFRDYLGEMY